MSLFQKDKKMKTEESIIKDSKDYGTVVKRLHHEFWKTGVIAVAALIAILVFSAAWFVANTSVKGDGVHISADSDRTFYLATRASDVQGVYDNNTAEDSLLAKALKKYQRIDQKLNGEIDISFTGLPQFSVGTTVITGKDSNQYIVGDADGISLMVNNTSNVNNTVENAYVGPGSKGEMTFYIIPTVAGPNQVTITVSLAAYKLTASGEAVNNQLTATSELIDGSEVNSQLRNILRGHMLLFQGKDSNGDYMNQIKPTLGEDGTIRFSFEVGEEDWVVNQPIEVTLYWVWPHRFENMVFPGQSGSVFKAPGTAQSQFLSWVNENKGFIVYQKNIGSLENASEDMSNLDLAQWSSGYNRGDQLIGNTIAYFTWTISAENWQDH